MVASLKPVDHLSDAVVVPQKAYRHAHRILHSSDPGCQQGAQNTRATPMDSALSLTTSTISQQALNILTDQYEDHTEDGIDLSRSDPRTVRNALVQELYELRRDFMALKDQLPATTSSTPYQLSVGPSDTPDVSLPLFRSATLDSSPSPPATSTINDHVKPRPEPAVIEINPSYRPNIENHFEFADDVPQCPRRALKMMPNQYPLPSYDPRFSSNHHNNRHNDMTFQYLQSHQSPPPPTPPATMRSGYRLPDHRPFHNLHDFNFDQSHHAGTTMPGLPLEPSLPCEPSALATDDRPMWALPSILHELSHDPTLPANGSATHRRCSDGSTTNRNMMPPDTSRCRSLRHHSATMTAANLFSPLRMMNKTSNAIWSTCCTNVGRPSDYRHPRQLARDSCHQQMTSHQHQGW